MIGTPEGPASTDAFLDWLADRERLIYECGAHPGGGHPWKVEAEPGETPHLTCEECPASGDDLVGDSCVYLEAEPYEIGGRTVDFGSPLPADAEPLSIPVHARVEADETPAGPWGPAEIRTILIHITPREVTP